MYIAYQSRRIFDNLGVTLGICVWNNCIPSDLKLSKTLYFRVGFDVVGICGLRVDRTGGLGLYILHWLFKQ